MALTRRYHLPSALRLSPTRVDADRAHELLAEGAALVDVRRKDDPALTLTGALRIPPDEIPDRLDELPDGVPLVLACT